MPKQAPQAPVYWLPRDVHAVAIADDLVFLDTARDAYFCLPGPTGLDLAPDRRSIRALDAAVALELRGSGLIGVEPPPARRAFAPPLRAPTQTLVPLRTAPPTWAHVRPAAWAVADVLRRYRGKSLAEILKAVDFQRAADPAASEPVREIVADFHRWIPYAPLSGKCLLRSFVLLRLLRRRGYDALWVFGVRTWPFHAHCWLQCGQMVLDDDVERVAAFTPIMAV
jgi:hypothetical protein